MARAAPIAGHVFSGKLGEIVFCKRGNSVYVRARVVPKNPRSPAQTEGRERFRKAVLAWRALSDPEKKKYQDRAWSQGRTGYNLFLAEVMQAPASDEG